MNALSSSARHRSRRRWVAAAVLAVLAMFLIWVPRWQDRQTRHGGRTVMEWAADLGSENPARVAAAREAILTLGPRAVPTLSRNVRRRDPFLGVPLVEATHRVAPGLSLNLAKWMNIGASAAARRQALGALAVLGPQAEAAIPTLARLVRRPPSLRGFGEWVQATHVLGRMGPSARAPLVDALANAAEPLQPHLLAALSELSPVAAQAVPEVVVLFVRHPEQEWRGLSGFLQAAGAEALPHLYPLLADGNPQVRERVRGMLDEMIQRNAGVRDAVIAGTPRQPAEVRLELARSLGRVDSLQPAVARFMLSRLDDPDAAVRGASIQWLRERLSARNLDRLLAGEPLDVQHRVRGLLDGKNVDESRGGAPQGAPEPNAP